jgi:hypothetical protein
MSRQVVRDGVRDAMRVSPWTEHKVSLRGFLASGPGGLLLREVATAAGLDPEVLNASVAQLPELDFYIPDRQHRLTWKASEDYIIAVNLKGEAPTFGYNATGYPTPIDLSQPEPPPQTVFMLQTAEPKTRRIHPQQSLSGSTIQDFDDGELGGVLVLTDVSGLKTSIELADLPDHGALVQCYEDCSSGGGSGSPMPETFLTYLETKGIVDNNNPFESNEFEFNATAWDGSTGFLRITGVGSRSILLLRDHLIYALPVNETSRIDIAVKETDGFLNPDDHFYYAADYLRTVPFGYNEEVLLGPDRGLVQSGSIGQPPCAVHVVLDRDPELGGAFGLPLPSSPFEGTDWGSR